MSALDYAVRAKTNLPPADIRRLMHKRRSSFADLMTRMSGTVAAAEQQTNVGSIMGGLQSAAFGFKILHGYRAQPILHGYRAQPVCKVLHSAGYLAFRFLLCSLTPFIARGPLDFFNIPHKGAANWSAAVVGKAALDTLRSGF